MCRRLFWNYFLHTDSHLQGSHQLFYCLLNSVSYPSPSYISFPWGISYLKAHILNIKQESMFLLQDILKVLLGCLSQAFFFFLSSVICIYKMTGRMGGEWELFASLKNKHLLNWLPYFFINTKSALWCRMFTALLWGAAQSFAIGSELCWHKPCCRVRAYGLLLSSSPIVMLSRGLLQSHPNETHWGT